jgi:predicted kinase
MDNDEFSEIEKEILKKFQDTVRNNKNSKNKQSIIIDRTNMSKKSRRKWLNGLDKDYNCKVEVFLMGEKIFKERNSSRNNSEGKHIGFKTIQEMVKHFTVPGMDEAHIVNYKVLSEKKDRKNIEFEKHKPIPYLKDKLKPAKPKTKDLEF